MKCDYCGAEVPAGEIFCRNCGTRQTPAPVKEAVKAPIAEPVFEPVTTLEQEDLTLEFPEIHISEPVKGAPPDPKAEPRTAYVPYGAPKENYVHKAPMLQLPGERGLGKMILLGILTLGIYPIVIWSRIVTELNIAASRYDGERTMPYFGMVLLALFTLFIYPIVWLHGFCRRIGTELKRRGIGYEFGAGTFWLWNVLGSLILVGPFVFLHKLMKATNMINRDFNVNG